MEQMKMSETPIAEHWREFQQDLPLTVNQQAVEAMRWAFFAGAAAAVHAMLNADCFARGILSRELSGFATADAKGVAQ